MPLQNILLVSVLLLAALVACVLLSNCYKAERKAKYDLAQLRKEAHYERQTKQNKEHEHTAQFFKVGKEE